jgi:hypothetical protein
VTSDDLNTLRRIWRALDTLVNQGQAVLYREHEAYVGQRNRTVVDLELRQRCQLLDGALDHLEQGYNLLEEIISRAQP